MDNFISIIRTDRKREINKYKNMGKEYPLEGVPEMKPEQAKKARMTILRAIQEVRRNL